MAKKEPMQEHLQESVGILSQMGAVSTFWSENDATMYIQSGAVLLGIARMDNDPDGHPFRFALGWPAESGPTAPWNRR